MAAPLEILTGPLEIYLAPVGEAVPATDVAPAGNWNLLGSSGDDNYTEDGVVISNPQVNEIFRALGGSGPRKVFRTEEDLMIRVTMADLTLEELSHAINEGTVTTDAGPPATKEIDLYRGPGEPAQRALLVRGTGKSPYAAGVNMQFQVPVVIHQGNYELIFAKAPPVGVLMEFLAIEDPTATSDSKRFGSLKAQTA